MLSGARKTAEVCRRQVDEKMALIEVSRMSKPFTFFDLILKFWGKNMTLKQNKRICTVQRKRKILMMLQVLEKRETLRVKRFEELGRLLVDLRYASGIGLSDEFT